MQFQINELDRKSQKSQLKMFRKILEVGGENFSDFEKTVLNDIKMFKNSFSPI